MGFAFFAVMYAWCIALDVDARCDTMLHPDPLQLSVIANNSKMFATKGRPPAKLERRAVERECKSFRHGWLWPESGSIHVLRTMISATTHSHGGITPHRASSCIMPKRWVGRCGLSQILAWSAMTPGWYISVAPRANLQSLPRASAQEYVDGGWHPTVSTKYEVLRTEC